LSAALLWWLPQRVSSECPVVQLPGSNASWAARTQRIAGAGRQAGGRVGLHRIHCQLDVGVVVGAAEAVARIVGCTPARGRRQLGRQRQHRHLRARTQQGGGVKGPPPPLLMLPSLLLPILPVESRPDRTPHAAASPSDAGLPPCAHHAAPPCAGAAKITHLQVQCAQAAALRIPSVVLLSIGSVLRPWECRLA